MRDAIAASRDRLLQPYRVPSRSNVPRAFRATLVLAGLAGAPIHAQILKIPPRSGEPGSFVSFAIGLRQQQSVSDGSTRSTWDFGQGVEYRASLENHMRNGTSVGIAYGQSDMPLRYSTTLSSVDARARVRTLMLALHGGALRGFHQVFDLGIGVTRYGGFRRASDNAAISGAPAKDDDLTLAIGYGFGYAFSARSALTIVQEYGLIVHQTDGLSGNTSRSSQAYTTRVGLRLGFGSRRRR